MYYKMCEEALTGKLLAALYLHTANGTYCGAGWQHNKLSGRWIRRDPFPVAEMAWENVIQTKPEENSK